APVDLCSLANAPDLFDDRQERLACGFECEDIGGKSVLCTKRLADPVGLNRSLVHAARDPVIIRRRLAEVLLKKGKRLLSEIESGSDPEPIHLRCRRQPNAVEF